MQEGLSDSPDGRTRRFRVLIVETSNVIHRELLSWQASGLDIEMETADPGFAFQKAILCEPNVILLDPNLPGHYAFDVARLLRELSCMPCLVFLDEEVRPGNIRKALEVGARGYWEQDTFFEHAFDVLRDIVSGKPSFCPGAKQYLTQPIRDLTSELPTEFPP